MTLKDTTAGGVEAVPLYRFLELGDLIEADDECPSDNCERWEAVNRWAVGMPRSSIFKIIRRRVAASPAPAPAAGVGLPQDVVRLVIAAREVAYSDPTPETIRELDKASEAFADRVPWEDEPKDDAAAVEPWFCGGCGETNPEKRCLGCMHGMEYPAPSPKAGETGNG